MNRRTLIKALAFLAAPAATAALVRTGSSTAATNWVTLGKAQLTADSHKIGIPLGPRAVPLSMVKIGVRGNGLWIYKVVLHHGPKFSTAIHIDRHIPLGQETTTMTLPDGILRVQAVSLEYANLPVSETATIVQVWGRV
jgi:hypothetical protein